MTTHQMIKKMSLWNGVIVPALGEIVIDQQTNKMKIGDGKTTFANLPYVETDPPESKLSIGARAFIEDHIELLDQNDFETFYSHIKTVELAREVSKALFEAGLNPKPYLTTVPRCIQDLLLDKVDNIDNKIYTNNYETYTKSEVDAKLHAAMEEFTAKMYAAMSIPAHLMTIKTGG